MSPPGAHLQAPNPPTCPASCVPTSEQNPPHPVHQPSGQTPERLPAPPSAPSSRLSSPSTLQTPRVLGKGLLDRRCPAGRREPPPAPGVACSTASPLTSAYPRPWGLWPGPCPLPAPPPSASPSPFPFSAASRYTQASLRTGGSLPTDTTLSLSGGAQAPRGLPQSPLSQAGSPGSSHVSPTPPSPEALIAPLSPQLLCTG